MILSFELSMPTANSWNGRWSGDGLCHAIVVTFPGARGRKRAAAILANAPYHYRWEDGWCAEIRVREVTSEQARSLRKRSAGFSGYDWMVTTIMFYGQPLATHEIPKFLEARKAAEAKAAEAKAAEAKATNEPRP